MSEQFNDRGPFQVGEVCIIVGARSYKEFIGCEAQILAVLGGGIYEVEVSHPKGKGGWWICEDNLRRKRPPTTGEGMIRAMFDASPQPQPVTEAA